MTEQSGGGLAVCATCGRTLEAGVDHPVRTTRTDESFELYSFCDAACRRDWAGRGDD
jgi:hypothetical protein